MISYVFVPMEGSGVVINYWRAMPDEPLTPETQFVTHARRWIASHGVFVAAFDDLSFLWSSRAPNADEKVKRILEFALANNWNVRAGIRETEVLFERVSDPLVRRRRQTE